MGLKVGCSGAGSMWRDPDNLEGVRTSLAPIYDMNGALITLIP